MKNTLNLWSLEPWNSFRDLDQVFENFISRRDQGRTPTGFSPSVDIEESQTHYTLNFDLPGISQDDLKIEVRDQELIVSGERKVETKKENTNFLVVERRSGNFQRSFTLPAITDTNKIEAHYQDGVLKISIPKAEEAKPRQIKVQTGKASLFNKMTGGDKAA